MKVFSGRRFDVETNKIILPNGNEMNVEKAHSAEVAVILPILSGQVIMLRQFRPVIGKWMYELPAGLIDAGEKPVDAARRELREETGFLAAKMHRIIDVFSSPGFSDEHVYIFFASDLKEVGQELEPSENIKLLKIPIDKAIDMAKSGKIKNVHSVAALILFDKQRKNRAAKP